MGERLWGGVVRPSRRRSAYFLSPGTNRRGMSAHCDNARHPVPRRKQVAASGGAEEGESTGEWCHAEAAAWIDVIGCCDDRSAGAKPSVCRCGPRRGRGRRRPASLPRRRLALASSPGLRRPGLRLLRRVPRRARADRDSERPRDHQDAPLLLIAERIAQVGGKVAIDLAPLCLDRFRFGFFTLAVGLVAPNGGLIAARRAFANRSGIRFGGSRFRLL